MSKNKDSLIAARKIILRQLLSKPNDLTLQYYLWAVESDLARIYNRERHERFMRTLRAGRTALFSNLY